MENSASAVAVAVSVSTPSISTFFYIGLDPKVKINEQHSLAEEGFHEEC